MLPITLFTVACVVNIADALQQHTGSNTEFCIIGAGPAGLQLGYFFQKSGMDYIIYERSSISGGLHSISIHYMFHFRVLH